MMKCGLREFWNQSGTFEEILKGSKTYQNNFYTGNKVFFPSEMVLILKTNSKTNQGKEPCVLIEI